MAALYARGIIVVRTAGNEGDPMAGQGLFYAGAAGPDGGHVWPCLTMFDHV